MSELRVNVPPSWKRMPAPQNPITYTREGRDGAALQFSLQHYTKGTLPNVNQNLLVRLCEKLTASVPDRRVVLQDSGLCPFGMFGTVAVRGSEPGYVRTWVLTNGQDFILTTFTSKNQPEEQVEQECADAVLSAEFI